MARAKAAAGLAVKIFVEQNEVTPMRIGRVFLYFAMAGSCPIFVRQKGAGEPAGDFLCDFPQVHHFA